MDDDIIYSWCFNSVECFDSTPSDAIIVLVKKLGEIVEEGRGEVWIPFLVQKNQVYE